MKYEVDDLVDDIIYTIEMISYAEYNDKLNIYKDKEETEKAQIEFEIKYIKDIIKILNDYLKNKRKES